MRKKNRSNKMLIQRLNFEKKDLFLDGQRVATIPLDPSNGNINMIGASESRGRLYTGSGACCDGPVSEFVVEFFDEVIFVGSKIPKFNVYDVLPVAGYFPNFNSKEGLLVTGFGCSGAGAELLFPTSPSDGIEIVSKEEYFALQKGLKRPHQTVTPRLRLTREGIDLDLMYCGWRLKPGKTTFETFCIDTKNEEYKVFGDSFKSVDLTQKLIDVGLDLERTVDLNQDYIRAFK